MKKDILTEAKHLKADMCQFLIDIVNLPSASCHEREVAQRITAEMTKLDFDEVRIDAMGNVIGRIGSGKRILAFDAHIANVDVGNRSLWDFDPYDSHVSDGFVSGRGAADQKGGLAAMVYAGKMMKEFALHRDFTIYFTGTVMEEDCDGLCWQYLIEQEKIRPDFVMITEPTNLGIYRGQRGRMEMKISVNGRSAHGSAPERGDNAIYKMNGIIRNIEKLHTKLRTDPFLGKGSIAVTQVISDSPSLCAIPDSCSIHLDRRLTWGESKKSATAEIHRIIQAAGGVLEIPFYEEKSYTGFYYPAEKYFPTWKIGEDHPLVQSAINNYRQLFEGPPRVDKWTFSTNAVSICGIHGIPCVGFGPGQEEMAHAPNERVPIHQLIHACAFYANFPSALREILNAHD